MMHTVYRKQIGRVGLTLDNIGQAELTCLDGYNESCGTLVNRLSADEIHDLQHMIRRALTALEALDSKCRRD